MWVVALTLGTVAWSAPASCPSADVFIARLGPVRSRVDARVIEKDDGFELRVAIDDHVRVVRASTCAEAADVAVFLVELSAQQQPARAPLVVPQTPGVTQPVEPVVSPRVVEHRVLVAGVVGAEWALLPEPVVRFGLSAQLDVPWLRLGATLRTSPAVRFVSGPAVVVLAPVLDAQLDACHLFSFGRLAAGPCVQGGLGLMWATAFSAVQRSTLVPVWAIGPGVRASFSLALGVEVQAFAAARFGPQPRYLVGDGAPVVSTSMLGLDTGLLLGVRL